jgi:hypothetical protein
MENEQIIYLDPEEELINVHERLENTNAGRIMLVVPPQTQLRSLVGWRLLHARVRELGQEVQIISSDRQIRAKAKAAGFRVVDSLESLPPEKPRHNNRPVRKATSGKLSQGTYKQGNNGNRNGSSLPQDEPQMPSSSSHNSSTSSNSGEMNREFDAAASSTFEIEDIPDDSHDGPYNAQYPLPIESVPLAQSASGDQDDGEFDSMEEDYYVARSIRKAAQSFNTSVANSKIEHAEAWSGKLEQSSEIPQPNHVEDDPFAYMEDIQPTALREQRASTFIQDIDQGIPDISDVPTEVHDVDLKDFSDEKDAVFKHDWSSRTWNDQMLEESGRQETLQSYSMSPRNSLMGNTMRPELENLDNADELIELENQPTRVNPMSPAYSSGASTPSAPWHEPQPIIPPSRQANKDSINPNAQQSKKSGATKSRRVNTNPPVNVLSSSNSNRNDKRNMFIVSITLGVLLVAFLAFLYFGSNATVTVLVPTQPVSVTGQQYVASINPKNDQQNTIPSHLLTYPATLQGQGTATGTVQQGNQIASGTVSCPTALTNTANATGTIQQGNQFASGTVIFSNKGSKQLDIPTCTVLSTTGPVPVQFVTVADILVLPDASAHNIPSVAPVQALLSGSSGNVASNSITLIPPDSLNKIARNNQMNSLASGTLTVTNPIATAGGTTTNVPAATSSDVNTLALKLYNQEQNDINVWLAKAVHKGDVAGKPVLLLNATPAVGQPAPDGTFTGVLRIKVLVIRSADIKMAVKAPLMTKALQMNPPSVLATQLNVTVNVTKSMPSQDGTTLSIIVDASGYRMQKFSAQQISQRLAGKSVDDALTSITNGQAGIKGYATVVHFPPFPNLMPFRAEQIHLVVQPELNNSAPKG